MAKHNISLMDVTYHEKQERRVEREHIATKRVEWWQRELAVIISDNFRCHSFYAHGRHIGFIGLSADVQLERAMENMHLKPGKPWSRTTANDNDNDALRQGYADGKRFNNPKGLLKRHV